MKNKTYLGLLASVILLSSCTIAPDQNSTPAPSDQNSSAQVSLNVIPDNQVQTPAAVVDPDLINFNGAISLKDPTFCNKIIQPDLKNKCLQTLNSQQVIADAVQKLDASGCTSLQGDDQSACSSAVDVAKAQQARQQTYIASVDSENTAIQSGDIKKCKQFQDPKVSDGCEYNILINKAQTLKASQTVCLQATSPDTQQKCLKYYQALYSIPNTPSPSK